jgi:hypothetical protein
VYNRATQAALAKGILLVKAAGNYGAADGAFRADVSVAAGAVAAGAAGEDGELAAASQLQYHSLSPSACCGWNHDSSDLSTAHPPSALVVPVTLSWTSVAP